jgi:hypothetical protein
MPRWGIPAVDGCLSAHRPAVILPEMTNIGDLRSDSPACFGIPACGTSPSSRQPTAEAETAIGKRAAPTTTCIESTLATVNAAVANPPTGYDNCEVAGLLYVQGESNDSTEAADAGNRFSALLANLKADATNATSLIAVIGEIAATGTNRDATRANQLALANSRTDIGYAESNGLVVHNQDGFSLHYDAESLVLLGERMAAEMITMGAFQTRPLPAWSNLHAWFVADNGMTFDTSSAVNRWASVQNGGAVRDLARAGFPVSPISAR